MKRWKTLLAVGVAAAGLALPASAMASGSSYQFFAKGVGTGQWQQGRSFSLTENLYRNGHQIGNDSVACRFFASRNSEYCHATFSFAGGSVFANGWVGPVNTFSVTIANGTGKYTNARGTLWVRSTMVGDNYHFDFTT
jgi:hypothetical protein